MGKKKKKISKRNQKEDFGTAEFYCDKCNHRFEIDRQTIWDIQEALMDMWVIILMIHILAVKNVVNFVAMML